MRYTNMVWRYHNVVQVLDNLKNKTTYLQSVALEANHFAVKYLTPSARLLYWQAALRR